MSQWILLLQAAGPAFALLVALANLATAVIAARPQRRRSRTRR